MTSDIVYAENCTSGTEIKRMKRALPTQTSS